MRPSPASLAMSKPGPIATLSSSVMEKLLEEISYSASEATDRKMLINAAYVDQRLGELAVNEDLSRYVL
jgi:ATP-dependent protease HslVU (ClpYQ) ATPase subunit